MRSPATLGGVRGELLELSPLRRGCGVGKVRRGRRHLCGINFPSRLSSEGRGPGRADRSPDRPDPPELCSIPGWSGPWRLRGLTSPRPVSLRRLWVWFPARGNQRREKVRPSNNGRSSHFSVTKSTVYNSRKSRSCRPSTVSTRGSGKFTRSAGTEETSSHPHPRAGRRRAHETVASLSTNQLNVVYLPAKKYRDRGVECANPKRWRRRLADDARRHP